MPGVVLEWNPAGKKDQAKGGAMKVTERYLKQDNCFLIAPNEPLYWFLSGDDWADDSLSLLDECLARMTYFGRAESIASIERVRASAPVGVAENCKLVDHREAGSVPVLCLNDDMTAALAMDEVVLRGGSVPPGTVWRYAVRPAPPRVRPRAIQRTYVPTSLIQFAVGASVEPPLSAATTITGRLRGHVLREALTGLNAGVVTTWREASSELRAQVADLAGKDAVGKPLEGHAHARYLVWVDGGTRLTRLFVYRARPFEMWERDAMLRAGGVPLGWTQRATDGWTVRLVPLDSAVPPPGGFDGARSDQWVSVTPFVPARHFLDRRGRMKQGESPSEQINEGLDRLGYPMAEVTLTDAGWVRTHAPRRDRSGATNNSRRSFHVTLRFAEPVNGPIILGHSSFFGLGLFAPKATAEPSAPV
jgi:CRISPR-associated protein Csb2